MHRHTWGHEAYRKSQGLNKGVVRARETERMPSRIGLRNKIVPYLLVLEILAFSSPGPRQAPVHRKVSPEGGRNEALADSLAVVCDVGNVACRIGFFGGIGDADRRSPLMEWPTGSDNHHLFRGRLYLPGFRDGTVRWAASKRPLLDHMIVTSSDRDPQALSALDTYSRWMDLDAGADDPLGIEVTQRTYAWRESYRDDFIVWDIVLKNADRWPLDSLYVAQFMDADIATAEGRGFWADDMVDFYGDEPAELIPGTSAEDRLFISYCTMATTLPVPKMIPARTVLGLLAPSQSHRRSHLTGHSRPASLRVPA